MLIGVPKEIKDNEFRVGMTPAGAKSLTSRGNKVLIEKGAGEGSGIKDAEYVAAATDADAVRAEMAAVPARSKRDFAWKLRSLGACPAIPSLSMGERRLLASVIADARILMLGSVS